MTAQAGCLGEGKTAKLEPSYAVVVAVVVVLLVVVVVVEVVVVLVVILVVVVVFLFDKTQSPAPKLG